MCLRSLGFVLIVFPGVLQAQRAAQGCDAPTLVHGNFLPRQEDYSHGATITYACDNGYKPAAEGWWATSACQHGRWSHEPQCIEESACLPPTIPNAQYREHSSGWYEHGSALRITCDEGFEHKNQNTNTTCENGEWSPVPVCERSSATSDSNGRDSGPPLRPIQFCGSHPVVENAVVVDEGPMYLKYQCKSFYRRVGPETVSCYSDGSWSPLPTCEESFCVMDSDRYTHYNVQPGQREYMEEGATKLFQCVWRNYYIGVQCANRRITLSKCCYRNYIYSESCRRFTEPI